ncbi:MAG: oligosaccharide flippase family protein, partial [Abditibacteriales bacterium]|nr:oligosaccharide flippase family protein [Abditibacteriales bacterium]MDW8364494.1 oligosaccharide flippase family protein [Abditibacteriales bacterium]
PLNPLMSPSRAFGLRKFFAGVSIIGALNVVLQLSGILTLPIVTRLLGAERYGTFTQTVAVVGLLSPLVTLGLPTAVTRFLAGKGDARAKREEFFSVLAFIGAVGCAWALTVMTWAEGIAQVAGCATDEAVRVLRIVAITLPVSGAMSACAEYLRASERTLRYSVMVLLQRSLELLALLVAGWQRWDLLQLTRAVVAAQVLTLLMNVSVIGRDLGFALPRFRQMRTYLRFGLPLVPTSFFFWVIHFSDRLLIGRFLGSAAVGVYAAAYNLATAVQKISAPIYFMLLPVASRLWDKGEKRACEGHFTYAVKFFLLLAIPATLGLTVLSGALLRTLTTEEFVAGSAIVPLVAAGYVLLQSLGVGEYALMLAQRTRTILLLLIPSAVLNVLLNLALLPSFGLVGSAVATLLTYAAFSASLYVTGSRHLKVSVNFVFVLRSLVASAVMAWAIAHMRPHGGWSLLATIGSGAMIYGVAMMALSLLEKRKAVALFRLNLYDVPRRAFRLLMD